MADKNIKSVNLLPEFLRTTKNSKFLSSTIDQLIQKPQLERLDGYIGSTNARTYKVGDTYISEALPLRKNYQLDPALIVKDATGTINDVVGLDDLVNEINLYGGSTDNFDRLFRSEFYSYNPHIGWDKFVNYQQYYWLVTGPDTINIDQSIDISDIVGQTTYTFDNGLVLSNGMKIRFTTNVVPESYLDKDYFVEGVGKSITLVDYDLLDSPEALAKIYENTFDVGGFDNYPFDIFKKLPIDPEYITINRASKDLNPWSRYNRWVHKDVITTTAAALGKEPVYPLKMRARRPIIEFAANLKLYNFGSTGLAEIDLIDEDITDAFSLVEGSAGHTVDGRLLQQGHRVVFSADTDDDVRSKIYQVNYVFIDNKMRLTLVEVESPIVESVVAVASGTKYAGTSWWFDGDTWKFAQQHTVLNQAPLFDLFDNTGNSYSDINVYTSNFEGNKIFGYAMGTGTNDPILGFPLKYKNSVGQGSYLFNNYFTTGSISITEPNRTTTTISTGVTYCKIGNDYFNVWSKATPYAIPLITTNGNTYYEPPLGLTNNPLNGPISALTLSEISDHFNTMTAGISGTALRDLPNLSVRGKRLISNLNPMPFAQFFIGRKDHSVIDALTKAADQYNQFKLAFLSKIELLDLQTNPVAAVDITLKEINANKTSASPYYMSDMAPYGKDYTSRVWNVFKTTNKLYPITSEYNPSELTMRSVLVYLNSNQLTYGIDYVFVSNDSYIEILTDLTVGDQIEVKDYGNTEGNFVPPTPTKLGLYPKFVPIKFTDTSYITPTEVIRCHDGSILVAYNDYRDDIVLELEKRIYNNIKAEYRSELIDINAVMPGAFRNNEYSVKEINKIIQRDFSIWSGIYGIDYTQNSAFDLANPFTWNYTGSYNSTLDLQLTGSWRNVYKYFYDTDHPHTAPWEMLGFANQPSWWEDEYGPAPYTAGNTILWSDLEQGIIRQGSRAGTDPFYSRLGLLDLLPVNDSGDLVDPSVLIASNITPYNQRQPWNLGDQGAAETAWRRSSYWPFIIQKLLALTKPALYSALMYDPIRVNKNIAGQWTYGPNYSFLNLKNVYTQHNTTLTTGYSVYVSEVGRQRTGNYDQELIADLQNININLFYKVGGFVDNSELQVIIDAIDPVSTSPGAILQPEDYSLILNVSNPIKSTAISGIIVQKSSTGFIIKGYDSKNPYFNIYNVTRNSTTPAITVGGISEPYLTWAPSTTNAATGLLPADTTTANSVISGTYYQQGQIVYYANTYYIVKSNHRSSNTFNISYFQQIPSLPVVGGVTVQIASQFDKLSVTQVPYGTEFATLQQVYDLIVGYGAWLEDNGFSFVEYNTELQSTLDWDYSAKEFLYWTTQNWADNSVITLSPFANQITFKLPTSVVDNIFDSFYEYSVLQANGVAFPQKSLNVNREDGVCTIQSVNATDGIYFARLNSIQKEHAIVFNNFTLFNDTIFNVETGYRQQRMKLVGFRTAGWDGDYFSPGFVYDTAQIYEWTQFTDYRYGDIVRFDGKYYAANKNVSGTPSFDFTKWTTLGKKPVAGLLSNFDYKISQFTDFYSLDIDNFDEGQQKAAQHLTGYTPRGYLNNIFTNPISQYKFYQGFIKEKGTGNAITKLARASIHNLNGNVDYKEEWAFRVGHYGSFSTVNEIEIPLQESTFNDNPQVINLVDSIPTVPNNLIRYVLADNLSIKPDNYVSTTTFTTTSDIDILQLSPAGYVRVDDVNLTAFNKNNLLSLTTNTLLEGSKVWLGSTNNGDWDVLRHTLAPARVVSMTLEVDQLNFVTDYIHGLSVGETVSIAVFDTTIDGVYEVSSVSELNEFSVKNTSTNFASSIIPDTPGLLFKFTSSRYNSFDALPTDAELLKLSDKSIVWTDSDVNGNWATYQKIKNYNVSSLNAINTPANQHLGWSISKQKNSKVFLVGNPGFTNLNNVGNVFVYVESGNSTQLKFRYGINNNINRYHTPNGDTGFGYAVAYDEQPFYDESGSTGYGLLFAGAPLVSNVKSSSPIGNVRVASLTGTTSTYSQEGLVKISSINPVSIDEFPQQVLLSPNPSNNELFGSSLYEVGMSTGKLLLVGAPQNSTTGIGSVYSYWITTSTTAVGTININYNRTVSTSSIHLSDIGSQWGASISGTANAEIIAISAPGWSTGTGLVSLFSGTNTNYLQTITSPFESHANFGNTVSMSSTGNYMFVSAPNSRGSNQSYGKVAVYERNVISGVFSLSQVIVNPVAGVGMKFGQSIDSNADATELVITAIGTNNHIVETFDKYVSLMQIQPVLNTPYVNDPSSNETDAATTFDLASTTFFDVITDSGSAYVYNRKNKLFKLADEFLPSNTNNGTNFGYSVVVNADTIYVGAPSLPPRLVTEQDNELSSLYKFSKKDVTAQSWNLLRSQSDLVSTDTIRKVTLFDSFNDSVISYLDVIDPLKGKILGVADQELKYKLAFDPAVYSIGTEVTVNNTNNHWLDNHVGELWWDLSTVKYVWYEQGSLEYRKTNWGKTFPGSSIDVYEWVGSLLLPSQWATIADTPDGLARGISGQPKYSDNSVISVKQIYNSISGSFTNYYYYWVKNSIITPNVKNRRNDSYTVARIIENPASYGLQYVSIIANNALAVANVSNQLVSNRVHLNIVTDSIDNHIPKHTEWLLLQEGSNTSTPPALIEQKLIDSLVGHDNFGNLVPDPSLSERSRYGISIRPRQTLFKDRFAALRNIIEFVNSVLVNIRVTGNYSFNNLNQQEIIPDIFTHEYDQIVEDNESLLLIDNYQFEQPYLSCTVMNGQIRSVKIDKAGYGYRISPNVTISGNTDAVITTEINEVGQIVSVTIVNAGSGFVNAPELIVRPYTVIVLTDNTYNNKWTKFAYDVPSESWIRLHTQRYNTLLYWKYIDWVSPTYNKFLDYSYVINYVYDLTELPTLDIGSYVKVKNGGLGKFIILEKTDAGVGTFDPNFNLVYAEEGTIQILNSLWDISISNLGWDQNNTYDQTLFDQAPNLELEYILAALKNDLFINELKVNWNLLFFKAVKFAMSEQKSLDWAFKTSFINVTNRAGELSQPPIYKLSDAAYYENYIAEVKPYHTQIRTFTTNNSVVDNSKSYITDFDLPATYDQLTNKFITVENGNAILASYPWKSWADNHSYYVGSISVGKSGSGYISVPNVVITAANGDSGYGATAIAYITSGKVTSIIVTNPGQGYYVAPIVTLLGGGENIIPATAYAQLVNQKVRSTSIGIKFDRTSKFTELTNLTNVNEFIGNGLISEFELSWLAVPDKRKIVVIVNGVRLLLSEFTIKYYQDIQGEYYKQRNKLVFLNNAPGEGAIIKVSYEKNLDLLNATDRILNYYTATSGMPGLDLGQLMTGINYPKTRIEGLKFDYSTEWDVSGYDTSVWADQVGYYTSAVSTSSSISVGGTWTSIALNTVQGIAVGQHVNIISTTTNTFNANTVQVIEINTASNTVVFNHTATNTIAVNSKIEFWDYNSVASLLDSVIEGGTWNTSTRISALGINPTDIIIDGDGFLTPNTSHAPEELVPGEIHDSLGINVYTKNPNGSPAILTSSFEIYNIGVSTVNRMSLVPLNINSLVVTFNNKLLSYGTDYSVNWQTNELIIVPQTVLGIVSYNIISMGSLGTDKEAGLLDTQSVTSAQSTLHIESAGSFVDTKSAYVTVNGRAISQVSTSTEYGYMLSFVGQRNKRAVVNIYNLPAGTNVATAWFFGTEQRLHNEIREQVISVDVSTSVINLTQAPGNSKPEVANAIVELNGKMLTPPHIDYYTVTDSNRVFAIKNDGTFNLENIRVYVNGNELRRGFDFVIASNNVTITILNLTLNDVVAILSKPNNPRNYDYDIIGSTLFLYTGTAGTLKVITYTNSDGMLMRTETFKGTPSNRYKISRPVLDENYIWVIVAGVPLANFVDFEILDDQVTVQISNKFPGTPNKSVIITTFNSTNLASTILGYRIFTDIFNRTHFKRLSKSSTTYLTRSLSFTDTEIHVADAGVFTPPNVQKNVPGVIIINGERIEFFTIVNNVLGQLRRSTLGTAPCFNNEVGTRVIDQSPSQTIPFGENIYRQSQLTLSTTTTYTISTVNQIVRYNINSANTGTFANDGITLSTIAGISAADQISVYYGGRLLNKVGTYHQDIDLSYDSPNLHILGTKETLDQLPNTINYGDAYVVASDNKVWVYTDSKDATAFNGYEYRGLNYQPPEFNVSGQQLTLNIPEGIDTGVRLTVVKRQFNRSEVWNTEVSSTKTLSIMDSSTVPARFLQASPAELPDRYYYSK
jgi:hypothetical protein